MTQHSKSTKADMDVLRPASRDQDLTDDRTAIQDQTEKEFDLADAMVIDIDALEDSDQEGEGRGRNKSGLDDLESLGSSKYSHFSS